jgi:addiction module RelB/DinJ family antitoxin
MGFEGSIWVDRTRDVQLNVRTNSETLGEAKKIFAKNNLDLTNAINLFLETVVIKKVLPIETVEELEKEKLIQELRLEMQKSMESIRMGKGLTISEAREKFWSTK